MPTHSTKSVIAAKITNAAKIRTYRATGMFDSNMFRVRLILHGVAAVLAFEIQFVLFCVGIEHVIGAHAEYLRRADQKMEQVHDFDSRILLIEFLVFGPPFPGHAVGQLGNFLRHGAAIIQQPFRFFLLCHAFGIHADALIQGVL